MKIKEWHFAILGLVLLFAFTCWVISPLVLKLIRTISTEITEELNNEYWKANND